MPKDKIVWNLQDIKYKKFFTYDMENLRFTSMMPRAKETTICNCAICRKREDDKKFSLYLVSRALDKVDNNNKLANYVINQKKLK